MRPDEDKRQPNEACCSRRQSAHELLRMAARNFRNKGHALEKLADEIEHEHFSPEASEVLWNMALNECGGK